MLLYIEKSDNLVCIGMCTGLDYLDICVERITLGCLARLTDRPSDISIVGRSQFVHNWSPGGRMAGRQLIMCCMFCACILYVYVYVLYCNVVCSIAILSLLSVCV